MRLYRLCHERAILKEERYLPGRAALSRRLNSAASSSCVLAPANFAMRRQQVVSERQNRELLLLMKNDRKILTRWTQFLHSNQNIGRLNIDR